MKRLFFLLISLAMLTSCNSNGQSMDLNVTEAFTRMEDKDVVVIDVRTPEEYSEGHIEGAEHINFHDENFEQQIKKLPKGKEYVVYCHSGNRSGKAQTMMKDLGYEKVYNLDGGIKAWKSEGKEVVK